CFQHFTPRDAMQPLELSARPVTLRDVAAVARERRPVCVTAEISVRLRKARAAVLEVAASGQSVYGLTSALGANTGKKVAGTIDDEAALVEYQLNAIRARSVAIGTPFPTETVRSMLFARIAGM